MKGVNLNENIKNKKYRKKEEDGSITVMLCLEANGMNKLHSIEEPALVNEKQRKKEYYLILEQAQEKVITYSQILI